MDVSDCLNCFKDITRLKRLTGLMAGPFLPFEPHIVVFGSGLGKDQPGELGAALGVEVGELDLGGHLRSRIFFDSFEAKLFRQVTISLEARTGFIIIDFLRVASQKSKHSFTVTS